MMMKFQSRYTSHQPDEQQMIQYSQEEHDTWKFLYTRQETILPNRAVDEFTQGLELLQLSKQYIPQIPELNQRLKQHSDWQVKPVAAVISSESFFKLLSEAYFPVATFIRRQEDMDYITEPDIFHEIFGHIPLLTQPDYANFVQNYAKLALSFPKQDWNFFLRLFWFTIEFGLIETPQGLRIYGGGILSSYGETLSCLTSDACYRAWFDPVAVLRTPYRIDQIQPLYFVIKNFSVLHDIMHFDFAHLLSRARELGLFNPLYQTNNILTGQSSDYRC
jgi:phenylalanine-4-hydroxylase